MNSSPPLCLKKTKQYKMKKNKKNISYLLTPFKVHCKVLVEQNVTYIHYTCLHIFYPITIIKM